MSSGYHLLISTPYSKPSIIFAASKRPFSEPPDWATTFLALARICVKLAPRQPLGNPTLLTWYSSIYCLVPPLLLTVVNLISQRTKLFLRILKNRSGVLFIFLQSFHPVNSNRFYSIIDPIIPLPKSGVKRQSLANSSHLNGCVRFALHPIQS